MKWRCVHCKRVREPGDPDLKDTLTARFRQGRCAGEKGRPLRFFETVPEPGQARDVAMGRRLKEKGMGRAEGTQAVLNPEWSERFDATVTALALSRVEFTSEDITARVGRPPSGSGSAVGARVNAAAKKGIIRWTGRMQQAERPNQHAALLKVWRGI
jgi:hypothetical protein